MWSESYLELAFHASNKTGPVLWLGDFRMKRKKYGIQIKNTSLAYFIYFDRDILARLH